MSVGIKNKVLDELLNNWLDEWKSTMPDGYLERFENQIPEKWLEEFEKTPCTSLSDLVEIRDELWELCGNVERWNKLNSSLKSFYGWTEKIQGQQIWKSNLKSKSTKDIDNPISWEDFLNRLIDILSKKESCDLFDESHNYLNSSKYPALVLHIEAVLWNLVPTFYMENIHGRRQRQNWKEFRDQAIELLLEGKRQRNESNIADQIISIVGALVDAAYKRETKVKNVYTAYVSSPNTGNEKLDEDFENVEDKPELLQSLRDLTDDPELIEFADKILENNDKVIIVKNSYRHRQTVIFKDDEEIAKVLGYSVEKVAELQLRLTELLKRNKAKIT